MKSKFAEVAVDVPLFQIFTYSIPEGISEEINIGSVVKVPFGRRQVFGYILKILEERPSEIPKKITIKPIGSLYWAKPLFSNRLIKLLKSISSYYHYPLGGVFRNSHPKVMKRSPKGEVIEFSVIPSPFSLNADQQNAVDEICKTIKNQSFSPYLLHGITGSGKTEVYLRSIEECLNLGKSAILLIPEISLTPQLVKRVQDRFHGELAVLHSSMSDGERFKSWIGILEGRIKLAVGARSSIFAPFADLGLIIVDEEHESSFKQEDRLRYNARDVALMRAKTDQCPIVLGSATPSLESYVLAQSGKYKYLSLSGRANPKSHLPKTEVIDLKIYRPVQKFLSSPLIEAVKSTLDREEQVILFVNRRGFSSFLMCKDCGHIYSCPNCSVTFTYHKGKSQLKCHYCEMVERVPESCSQCGSLELRPMGLGTESVEEEISLLFPQARVARLDRDSTSRKGELEKILNAFEKGETNLLVGTQMIAKGHDFPNVSLVGLVMPDLSLNLPDFRAGEKTFQLITQVSGRAGRAETPGRVVLQTYNPSHYVIECGQAQDYEAFVSKELEVRQQFAYPPFTRMAMIRVQASTEAQASETCHFLEQCFYQLKESFSGLELLGPGPSPLEKIKNQFRWQMLVRTPSASELNAFLNSLQASFPDGFPQRGVKLVIDVDPVTTL